MDDRSMAALDLLPGLGEPGQLVVAAHQRRQPPLSGHLQPADGSRRPQDPVHHDGPRDALEVLGAERLGDDVALDQGAGVVGDQDRLRSCDRLQPGGDVRRLADDRHPLPRLPHPHLAGDHDAGVDADAHPQRDPMGVAQPAVELLQLLEQGQPGVHGALGAVLTGLGIAEVDDDAVAGVARDVAEEAVGGARAGLLIPLEDLAEVLGIKRLGQRR
jgi:hypothetical protein